MKNKFLLAITTAATALVLAGCPAAANEGTAEGRAAALKAAATASIASAGTGQGKEPIMNDEFSDNNRIAFGCSLSLLTQYSAWNRKEQFTYVVKISWDFDEGKYGAIGAKNFQEGRVRKWEQDSLDENAFFGQLNYTNVDQDFEFHGHLSIGDLKKDVTYKLTLEGKEITVTDMTHDEFYAVSYSEEKEDYYFTNWQYSGGANFGKSKDYYYKSDGTGSKIHFYGKVTYVAQDGNFAYVENGDKVLSMYHTEWSENPAMFVVGKYIHMRGTISSYHGMPQISNMDQIEECTAEEIAAHIVEPVTTPVEVTAKQLAGEFTAEGERFNQFSAYHHRAVTLNGEIASLPYNESGTSTTDGANRFLFKVKDAEGTEVEVAWNYHVDGKTGDIGNPLIQKIISAGVRKSITVTGRLTYANPTKDAPGSFYPGNVGAWTITPLALADVVIH